MRGVSINLACKSRKKRLKRIKVVTNFLINRRHSGIGFTLHVREKEIRKPSFSVFEKERFVFFLDVHAGDQNWNRRYHRRSEREHHHRQRPEIRERVRASHRLPRRKKVGYWLFVNIVSVFVRFLYFRLGFLGFPSERGI